MAIAVPGHQEEAGVRLDLSRLLAKLPGRQRRLLEGVKLRGEAVADIAQVEVKIARGVGSLRIMAWRFAHCSRICATIGTGEP